MSKARCTPGGGESVSLPVVKSKSGTTDRKIKKSGMGKWRALVLIGLHVLILIHVAHWLWSGSTISPVEPSEGMEFARRGVINAGLIFFVLALAATLIFGRWVCGWGCHLVALQDLSRWGLEKVGIRPRPLRTGMLALIPIIAALAIFVGPAVYGWFGVGGFDKVEMELTRADFWRTFPPWIPAILTFVVCGFAMIYFLGAKGFCTYACPYGGFFGAVDNLAPLSIRVTDDCEQCGHCTAVCTSNVRVHQEVRDYGMVVDPGCMKCMDCVSVCPNDALYVGWGTPALFAKPRNQPDDSKQQKKAKPAKQRAQAAVNKAERRSKLARWTLYTAFAFVTYYVLLGYERLFLLEWSTAGVSAVLTGMTLGLLFLLPDKATRKQDYSLGEEALFGALFLAAVFAFRGLYDIFGLLFALGWSVLLAYLAVQTFRVLRRDNVSMIGRRLKLHGKLQPAGMAMLGVMALVCVGWVHSGYVQYHAFAAQQAAYRRHSLPPAAEADKVRQATRRQLAHVNSVLSAAAWQHRGISLATKAQLLADLGEFDRFEALAQQAIAQGYGSLDLRLRLASQRLRDGRVEDALEAYHDAARAYPTSWDVYTTLGQRLAQRPQLADEFDRLLKRQDADDVWVTAHRGMMAELQGDAATAQRFYERAVEQQPDLAPLRYFLGSILLEQRRAQRAASQLREALALGAPAFVHLPLASALIQQGKAQEAETTLREGLHEGVGMVGYLMLAEVRGRSGDLAGAEAALREGLEAGGDAEFNFELGRVLEAQNRPAAAAKALATAVERSSELVEPRRTRIKATALSGLEQIYRRLGKIEQAMQARAQLKALRNSMRAAASGASG